MKKIIKSIPKLIISIALPLLVGYLSSLLTKDYVSSYESLIKPSFAPPNWIFAPVWTILYILMGLVIGTVKNFSHIYQSISYNINLQN